MIKNLKLLVISILLINTNLIANVVANITSIKGEALIKRNSENIDATLGASLEEKDSLKTGDNSKLQIIFKDETIISLGKNSNFSIEKYLFENNKKPVAKFSMIRGAMRTITGQIGKIAPRKFSVITKSATIGIRGTNFTIIVKPDNSIIAYCSYGAIDVNILSKKYIVRQSFLISISPNKQINIKEFSAKDLKNIKERYFKVKTTKHSSMSKTVKPNNQMDNDNEEGEQLDLRVDDESGVIIKNITQDSSDNILNPGDITTDSAVIAGYSMNNAVYLGSYSTSSNMGTLPEEGDTKLSIDFDKDTALLEIGDFNNPSPTAKYDFNKVNSNRISGTQRKGIGSATGTFYREIGNVIRGSFSYSEGNKITADGTYSAKTFQALH